MLRILSAALILLAIAPAHAAKGKVTAVAFERTDQAMIFQLDADQPLDPTRVERVLDDHGRVLVLRVGGVEHARRRWLKTPDPKVRRTLLHNSKQRPPAALVRVRFRRPVPPAVFDAIQLTVNGNRFRAVVPHEGVKPRVMTPVKEARAPRPTTPPPPVATGAVAAVKAKPAPRGKACPVCPAQRGCPKVRCPKPRCPKGAAARVAAPKGLAVATAPIVFPAAGTLAPAAPIPAADALAGLLQAPKASSKVVVLPTAVDAALGDDARPTFAAALLNARLRRKGTLRPVSPGRTAALIRAATGPDAEWQATWDSAASAGRLMGAETVLVSRMHTAGDAIGLQTLLLDARTGKPLARGTTALEKDAYLALYDETVDRRTVGGAIWRSALAPGWGQIYNGDVGRGAGYASVAGALFLGAAASVALGAVAASDYTADDDPANVGRRDDANAHYDRANLLLVGLAAVWIGNVVDAWLSAEPRETIDHAALEAR